MNVIIPFIKNYLEINYQYRVGRYNPEISEEEFENIINKLNIYNLKTIIYRSRSATAAAFQINNSDELKEFREKKAKEVLFHIEKRKNYHFDRVIKNRLDDSEFIYAFCVDNGDPTRVTNYYARYFIGFEKGIPKIIEVQNLNYEEGWDKETVIWDIDTSYNDDDRRFKLEDIGEVVEVVKFEKPEDLDHIKYWESL